MDGFVASGAGRRRTLRSRIGFVGVGLHSGQRIRGSLGPGTSGEGIVFQRTDLGVVIPARYDQVVDTRLCTVLGEGNARIGTVEHIMAALFAHGVDDAVIELDGPEVPIFDGSAEPFQFLIDCAGIVTHLGMTRSIEVLKTVRVVEGEGPDAAWAELRPADGPFFEAELSIDFAAPAIGQQWASLRVTPGAFREELAAARTFTMAGDVVKLREAGLALGGSLDNAVVVDGAKVLNPGGLRSPDEFVRHKLLDVVGDLGLAGAPLAGRFVGHRTGHALNNRLLSALFADRSAWCMTGGHSMADGISARLPAAAAAF
jgi:UDP-3-O-[3-hydroxymyristoyl] N-acetylglucosamine deacetylase